jgi:hypothetical protein
MRNIIAAALLCACGDVAPHTPNLASPTCARVATHAFTAGEGQCILLTDPTGFMLFQREDQSGCAGARCLLLEPGETGYALAKIQPGAQQDWDVFVDSCDSLPACEN